MKMPTLLKNAGCCSFILAGVLAAAVATAQEIRFRNTLPAALFNYYDSLGDLMTFHIKEKERSLYTTAPVLFTQANMLQTPFLLYPGETVVIKTDSVTGNAVLEMPGNDTRTNELSFLKHMLEKTGGYRPASLLEYTVVHTSEPALLREFDKIHQKKLARLSTLDSFAQRKDITDGFRLYATAFIESSGIFDSLMLTAFNRKLLTETGKYGWFMDHCVAGMQRQEFQPFIPYLAAAAQVIINHFGLNYAKTRAHVISFQIVDSLQMEQAYKYIDQTFTGRLQSYLKARTVISARSNNIRVPGRLVDDFYASCVDSNYRNMFAAKFKEVDLFANATGEDEVIDGYGNKLNLAEAFQRYKNKVVVVDFWASWCVPCRKEFPYSRKLQEVYKEKNVAFIFISIDKSPVDWRRGASDEQIPPGDNYLIMPTSGFLRTHNIRAIPRYMVIGRNGKLIDTEAPRPSDPQLQKLIDQERK